MKTVSKEIVKVDPAYYGIEESKAADIAAQFKPMLDKMVELETEYNGIIALPVDDIITSRKAKELRLKYVKVRTGTAAIHQQQKAFYLSAGRFIDGWKNAQVFASQGIEEKLQSIENYFENQEKERIASLQADRSAMVSAYGIDGSLMNFGTMQDEVWDNYLMGARLAYEAKKAAEAKAEADRVQKEKEETEERERVRLENVRLQAENEAKEKALKEQREKAEKERLAQEALRKMEQEKADALLEAQRKASAAKAAKEKELADAKLKAEREAKEKAEAELKAAKDEEEKRLSEEKARKDAEEKARIAAEKKAKAAPDKAKLVDLSKRIQSIELPECTSPEAIAIMSDVTNVIARLTAMLAQKLETI